MKKNFFRISVFFLFIFFLSLPVNSVLAEEEKQLPTFQMNGEINLGYDYNAGFASFENGRVLENDLSQIVLAESYRNYLYINSADFYVKYNAFKIITLNLSSSLISRGLNSEPLYNLSSYLSFREFMNNRKNGLNNLWQRYGIIQDINFTIRDDSVNGGVTFGQQLIPFGYISNNFLEHPVVISPAITPLTEYINFNLRNPAETPYQNSTLTKFRDIGASVYGKYSVFSFVSGVYNGAGQNTLDNNNEKDFFARLDFDWGNFSQLGLSHWRGKHLFYRNIYDENISPESFEMSRTGLHGRIGSPDFYLLGEFILAEDAFNNDLKAGQTGWYIESSAKLGEVFKGSLRYEDFFDQNIRKNSGSQINYQLKKASFNLRQNFLPNLSVTEEYSQVWEDLNNSGKIISSSFGIFSANVIFTF